MNKFLPPRKGILVLIALFLLSLPLLTPRIHSGDEMEYYAYLRSMWMDGDLDFYNEYKHFIDLDPIERQGFKKGYLDNIMPTGLRPNRGSIGPAILWTPFFALGHLTASLANLLGYRVALDGYSPPYVWAVSLASAIYGFVGLLLTYTLCRNYFSEASSILSVIVIWFASPLLFYMYITPPMSHASSVFASSLFLFIWYRTRHSRTVEMWTVLGLLAGLMTLVRWQDGLFMIIPAVESIMAYGSWLKGNRALSRPPLSSLRPVPAPIKRLFAGILLFVVTAFAFSSLQLVTWQILHGSFHPSYSLSNDRFAWTAPYLGGILFSPYRGVFVFTPALLLATLGLYYLYKADRTVAIPLIAALASEVYFLGSYSRWNSHAFGLRTILNCTPIFILGLAGLVERLRRRVPMGVLAAVGALFIIWNAFLVIQWALNMIPRTLETIPTNDLSSLRTIIYNQFFVVPPKLLSLIGRFFFNRGSFYRLP